MVYRIRGDACILRISLTNDDSTLSSFSNYLEDVLTPVKVHPVLSLLDGHASP